MEKVSVFKRFFENLKTGVKEYMEIGKEFAEKEDENLVKNAVIAIFCGLPIFVSGIPFYIFGMFTGMGVLALVISALVFIAEVGFDAVRFYVEEKKSRIKYYILIAASSTMLLVVWWAIFRVVDFIVYGG